MAVRQRLAAQGNRKTTEKRVALTIQSSDNEVAITLSIAVLDSNRRLDKYSIFREKGVSNDSLRDFCYLRIADHARQALLWQQKIYIDAQTKQITKIDLPFGIKLQTSAPVIAVVFMGFALIIVPVLKHKEQNIVALKGHVTAPEPLKVYAVAAQQETNGDVLLEVPGDAYYTIMYLPKEGAAAFDSQLVDLVKRHEEPFPLRGLQVKQISAGNTGAPLPAPVHAEAPDVVSQFK
jgi:hypothetical protein